MNDERWATVDRLFGAALERPPHERAAFLREACAEDESLRRDVESLLTHASKGAGFLSTPAFAGEAAGDMASFVGRQLGPYAIQAPLGVGGMGEVYRARDGTLGRDVAIKILPRVFSTDPDRRGRFDREARLLAALNHPHIGAIYGVEDSNGVRALVLELVEGDTLADRLSQGPISVSEAVHIARQIADALEAAHEKGIVHRDLKPANIKVTPEGVVKVLDFGLAKAAAGDTSGPDLTQSPAVPLEGTRHGVILGTAAYMSPEQARGRPVDKRTDIWAFGCVLYEMLTGTQPFPGGDLSEILAGIIKSEPNWEAVPADVPPVLGVWLRRCLHKDSRQRVRDIGDLRLALDGAFDTASHVPGTSVVGGPPRSRSWPGPWLVAAASASLVAVTAFAVWALVQPAGPSAPMARDRYRIPLPPADPANPNNVAQLLTISPDAQLLLYVARHGRVSQLYSHTRDVEADWTEIVGAEGATGGVFISPDSAMVGFIDVPEDAIKKLSLEPNHLPEFICKRCGLGGGVFRGATWGSDDSIVFATTAAQGLMQVQAGGGLPVPLTSPRGGEIHLEPHFLTDGKGLVFTVRRDGLPDRIAVYAREASNQRRILLEGRSALEGSSPRFASSGHLVFLRGATLWAAPFDSGRLQLAGPPTPVLKDVVASGSSAWFSMARDGTLVYSPLEDVPSDRTFVWVNRNKVETEIAAPAMRYGGPRLSPNGEQIAVAIDDRERDIWIWRFIDRVLRPFTRDRGEDRSPVWIDDQRLAFRSNRFGPFNLFWQDADGTGPATQLTSTSNVKEPYSAYGTQLVFGEQVQRTDLMSLSLYGEANPQPLVQTPFGERDAAISPQGRWLAYSSDVSGPFEIWVGPLGKDNNAKAHPITTGGGYGPVWAYSPNRGLELFYETPASTMMVVRIDMSSGKADGPASSVFDATPYVPTVLGRMYDVSPDGERFLMLKPSGRSKQAAGPTSLVVVLNWFEDLKARAQGK